MTLIVKTLSFAAFLFMLPTAAALAQPAGKKAVPRVINIPMEPASWHYDSSGVEFILHDNKKAARIKKAAPLILKDLQFSNGTIEYDMAFGFAFPGITFHVSPDGRKGDQFYLRYFGSTSPESRTTLQYAAMIDSMSIWDLTDEYQAGARLNIPGWNHIKLVISGKQMKAYVNDMQRPALVVPMLEGETETGRIAFSGGEQSIANLVIRPDAVEDLSPAAGYLSNYNDTRYLRNWEVSRAVEFPFGKDIAPPIPYLGGKRISPEYPDSTTTWTPLATEPRGMLNLTRHFGATDFNKRRLTWVKTTIRSDSAQERKLHLGFNDEVWIFLNGQLLYADKNHFGSPGQKFPQGRCTIENTTIRLPLQKGNNEVLVAITNYFYGWGIMARLDATEGIHLP